MDPAPIPSPDDARTQLAELGLLITEDGYDEPDCTSRWVYERAVLQRMHRDSWLPPGSSSADEQEWAEDPAFVWTDTDAPLSECALIDGRLGKVSMDTRQFAAPGSSALLADTADRHVTIHGFFRAEVLPEVFGSLRLHYAEIYASALTAQEISQCLALREAASLTLCGMETGSGLLPVLESNHLNRLRHLHLSLRFQNEDAAEAVSRANRLQLESLALGTSDPQGGPRGGGDAACRILARAKHLASLRSLKLESAGVTWAGIEELLTSRVSPQLATLAVTEASLSEMPAGARRCWKLPEGLRTLQLEYSGLDDAGIEFLCASGMLRGLTSLDLSANNFGDQGAAALARTLSTAQLKHLNILGNHIGRQGLQALGEAGVFRNLRSLWLDSTDEEGVIQVLRREYMPALRRLGISSMDNGDRITARIADSGIGRQLTHLSLQVIGISGDSLRSISETRAGHLRHLRLGMSPWLPDFAPSDVEALALSASGQSLNFLDLWLEGGWTAPHAAEVVKNDRFPHLVRLSAGYGDKDAMAMLRDKAVRW